jgi:hypothetical protein
MVNDSQVMTASVDGIERFHRTNKPAAAGDNMGLQPTHVWREPV